MTKKRLKALVVDDEEDIRWQLMRVFLQKGVQCECTEDGQKALKLCDNFNFDIVVTDLKMPQVHGHKFASKILEAKDPPLVVVITGITETSIINDLFSLGVEDIIFKPFNVVSNVDKILALYERSLKRKKV